MAAHKMWAPDRQANTNGVLRALVSHREAAAVSLSVVKGGKGVGRGGKVKEGNGKGRRREAMEIRD